MATDPFGQHDPAIRTALCDHWQGLLLREPQTQAIRAVLEGADSVVTLSTGFGKSIIFQLPAAARAEGVTVAVSPLLALAADQLEDLDERGVSVAQYASCVDERRKAQVLEDLAQDKPEIRLLYLTPESLQSGEMQEALRALHARRLLHAIAVDEAHCGHLARRTSCAPP